MVVFVSVCASSCKDTIFLRLELSEKRCYLQYSKNRVESGEWRMKNGEWATVPRKNLEAV